MLYLPHIMRRMCSKLIRLWGDSPGRLTQAMLETARDMRDAEILDETAYAKITVRHLGVMEKADVEPLTGDQIRAMRQQAHI